MSRGIQPVLNYHSKRRETKKNPALSEHPSNGLPTPTSQTEGSHTYTAYSLQQTLNHVLSFTLAYIQTHFLSTLTHGLITHGFPLPTVTGKQCPPLPSQCSPPLPSLHFSSHQLCSSPFLLCCGSCDRGIPSLLTPPMGCAQIETMYSNGSVKLPQFFAKGSFHTEVGLCQFCRVIRCRRSHQRGCCSGCSCTS